MVLSMNPLVLSDDAVHLSATPLRTSSVKIVSECI